MILRFAMIALCFALTSLAATACDATSDCILAQGTYRINLQLDGYGIAKGCHADFVLLQARDPVEALRLKATRLKVFKRGQLLAQSPAATAILNLPNRPAHTSFMNIK